MTKKTTQLVTFFTIAAGISSGLVIFVIPLYMKMFLHMDIGQIGIVMTIYPIALVIGSLFGGIMADRWSRKMILFIVIIADTVFYPTLLFANTWQIFAVIYGVCGFFDGGWGAGLDTLMMDVSNPKIGATQFSILTSLTNFGETGTGSISGSLVALLGFGRIFLLSSWISGPALLILYFIRPKKKEMH